MDEGGALTRDIVPDGATAVAPGARLPGMRFRVGVRSVAARLWALPTTLIGLVVAGAALFGGRARVEAGVVEVWGGALGKLLRIRPPGVAAMALGHVILAMTKEDLERHSEHERVHVRQCERWGPLFLPAYAASSLWAWLRGRDPYRGNAFEREAFAAGGPRLAMGSGSGSLGSGPVSGSAGLGPDPPSGSTTGSSSASD